MLSIEEQLNSSEVTQELVLQYLWSQHDSLRNSGQPSPPVSMFFNEHADFEAYKKMVAWWPKRATCPKLPMHYEIPTPMHQLLYRYDQGPNFAERMIMYATRVVTWMESNNVDLANPNESRADRKARLNREAQARFRVARRAEAEHDPRYAAVEAARAVYETALATRATKKALQDSLVGQAQEVFLEACRTRKDELALQDQSVKMAREMWEMAKRDSAD